MTNKTNQSRQKVNSNKLTYSQSADTKIQKMTKTDDEKLLREISRYLRKKGWDVFVIQFRGISKLDRKLKGNYSLIIDFTGRKTK